MSLTQANSGTLTATISGAHNQPLPRSPWRAAIPAVALRSCVGVGFPSDDRCRLIPVAAGLPGTAIVTATPQREQSAKHHHRHVSPGPTLKSLLPGHAPVTQGATGTFTVTISAAQLADTVVPFECE